MVTTACYLGDWLLNLQRSSSLVCTQNWNIPCRQAEKLLMVSLLPSSFVNNKKADNSSRKCQIFPYHVLPHNSFLFLIFYWDKIYNSDCTDLNLTLWWVLTNVSIHVTNIPARLETFPSCQPVLWALFQPTPMAQEQSQLWFLSPQICVAGTRVSHKCICPL